jgi:hypothetical protein
MFPINFVCLRISRYVLIMIQCSVVSLSNALFCKLIIKIARNLLAVIYSVLSGFGGLSAHHKRYIYSDRVYRDPQENVCTCLDYY